jgi:hypothetical protein
LALFSAIQVETGQPLGPPDGRYLMRPGEGEPPSHVLVFAGPQVTIISVEDPLGDERAGAAWLKQAGEGHLEDALGVLNQVMHAFRQIVADASVSGPGRRQLVLARAGYGDGEQLAEGRLDASRELTAPRAPRFQRRSKVLEPQARLAAALAGREPPLVCAELALRATHDLESGRAREAALGTMIALDAAITELSLDPLAGALAERIEELRSLRAGVTAAAQTALAGALSESEIEAVATALGRTEAVLRARAVANA